MRSSAPKASNPPNGIGAIPTLPIFFKLRGRPVLLAGGSLPAVWKAELLAAAGAAVVVIDPEPCADMRALVDKLGSGLTLVTRHWSPEDLSGAALAIGALEGDDAATFRQAAHEAGVPVNIIDVPALCDFQFGTIVARSPLLIAISTDGAAPVFGQALRARIEALLPAEVTAWAQAAKDWRPDLQALSLGFSARRRFWEVFADRALAGTGRSPTDADRRSCMDAALAAEGIATPGTLDLVGLGPGAPDLVTLRAVRALQSADIVVHPVGIDPELIGLARREARRVPELAKDAATAHMIEVFIQDGKRVVWAAPGDPSTCLRWLDRRVASSITPRQIVSGLRCETCPMGCAGLPLSGGADQ